LDGVWQGAPDNWNLVACLRKQARSLLLATQVARTLLEVQLLAAQAARTLVLSATADKTESIGRLRLTIRIFSLVS